MHCYECAKNGLLEGAAVALCRGCNAALCLRHVREEAATAGAGGTRIGCGHDTWHIPAAAAAADVPAYAAVPAPA